jgi:hypothetical protein
VNDSNPHNLPDPLSRIACPAAASARASRASAPSSTSSACGWCADCGGCGGSCGRWLAAGRGGDTLIESSRTGL